MNTSMARPVVGTLALAMSLALATLLPGCGTPTLGDNLGVTVSASGHTVEVQIAPQHAWNSLLMRQGADLVAEYQMPGAGLVREPVAGSSAGPANGLRFTLPPQLRGNPGGSVCLYVQVRGNRSVLPVRKTPIEGDTGRFRVAPWEQAMRARASQTQWAAERTGAEQRVQAAQVALDARTAALRSRGWLVGGSCEAIREPDAVATTAPLGVLPVAEHDTAARMTCINRVLTTKRLRDRMVQRMAASSNEDEFKKAMNTAAMLAGMGEAAAGLALRLRAGEDANVQGVVRARQQEARTFLADLQTYSPRLGAGFHPAFGKPDEHMTLVAQARPLHAKAVLLEHAERANLPAEQRPVLSGNDQLALAGGMLDAYLGCVSDGKRELQVKLQAWTDLQRDAPDRNRRIREHLVRECRSQQASLAVLQQEQQRAVEERNRLLATPAPAPVPAAPGADNGRSTLALNQTGCNADR